MGRQREKVDPVAFARCIRVGHMTVPRRATRPNRERSKSRSWSHRPGTLCLSARGSSPVFVCAIDRLKTFRSRSSTSRTTTTPSPDQSDRARARGARRCLFHRCRVPSRAPLPVCVRESRVLKWGERHAASACALKSDAAHDIDVTRADAPKRSCASLCAIGGARSASRAVSHDVTRGIGD